MTVFHAGSDWSVRIDFSPTLLPTATFQLLKSGQPNGPWVPDSSAVLTTNVPGSSYRFPPPTGGAPTQFFPIASRCPEIRIVDACLSITLHLKKRVCYLVGVSSEC
jgi:hypothetical protein